jgi:hypothetical protein
MHKTSGRGKGTNESNEEEVFRTESLFTKDEEVMEPMEQEEQ